SGHGSTNAVHLATGGLFYCPIQRQSSLPAASGPSNSADYNRNASRRSATGNDAGDPETSRNLSERIFGSSLRCSSFSHRGNLAMTTVLRETTRRSVDLVTDRLIHGDAAEVMRNFP